VPRISAFYGITIWMFWNEGHHARPRFHARYAGQSASVAFDGEVIVGDCRHGRLRWSPSGRSCIAPSSLRTGSEPVATSLSSRSSRCRRMLGMQKLVDISGVEVIGTYRLRLAFADGTVGKVDFGGREWRGVFEQLRDPAYFAQVAVNPESGTIAWPNGADMAPEPLYEEARRHLVSAA
jgi:Protein of unknown function (DUF2442)/Domain of unknown function (DUF4160)